MSAIDHVIIWGNLLGCLLAVGANVAAAHVGFLMHRGLTATIAAIAATYAIGYALLLFGPLEFAEWSAFYRGVSIVVWPVVWAGPALLSLASWRHTQEEVRAVVEGNRVAVDHPGG